MTNQEALEQLREYFPEGYIAVAKKEEISWQAGSTPDTEISYSLWDGTQHYYGRTFEECFYYLEKEAELEEIRARMG